MVGFNMGRIRWILSAGPIDQNMLGTAAENIRVTYVEHMHSKYVEKYTLHMEKTGIANMLNIYILHKLTKNLSETGWQIHLPRKQRLINRKRHRHTANEGMDSYR